MLTAVEDRKLTIAPRIWDVENKRKQKSVIVVKSKDRGARTKVNACTYTADGSMIGGGETAYSRAPLRIH